MRNVLLGLVLAGYGLHLGQPMDSRALWLQHGIPKWHSNKLTHVRPVVWVRWEWR